MTFTVYVYVLVLLLTYNLYPCLFETSTAEFECLWDPYVTRSNRFKLLHWNKCGSTYPNSLIATGRSSNNFDHCFVWNGSTYPNTVISLIATGRSSNNFDHCFVCNGYVGTLPNFQGQ